METIFFKNIKIRKKCYIYTHNWRQVRTLRYPLDEQKQTTISAKTQSVGEVISLSSQSVSQSIARINISIQSVSQSVNRANQYQYRINQSVSRANKYNKSVQRISITISISTAESRNLATNIINRATLAINFVFYTLKYL